MGAPLGGRHAAAAGRFRLYTREDVNRRALLKQLVDAGHAIGSIARLPLERLQARQVRSGQKVSVNSKS